MRKGTAAETASILNGSAEPLLRCRCRPSLLIVGPLTVDVVDGKHALGGAVSYAAAVAAGFGIKACVVTTAAPDTDVSPFSFHDLHIIHSNSTLTFHHTYTMWGNKRKLRVTAQPNVQLSMSHVPPACRRARAILLGPLVLKVGRCWSLKNV